MTRDEELGAPPGYGELGPEDRDTQQPCREKKKTVSMPLRWKHKEERSPILCEPRVCHEPLSHFEPGRRTRGAALWEGGSGLCSRSRDERMWSMIGVAADDQAIARHQDEANTTESRCSAVPEKSRQTEEEQ
jgi:hypothetical protein